VEAENRAGGPTPPAPEEEPAVAENDAPMRGDRSGAGVDPASSPSDGPAAAVEEDLDALLGEARRERDEYLNLAQRARADFENFRKRAAEDSRAAERRGRAGIVERLLPSIDNLERALLAAGIDPSLPAAEQTDEPASEEVTAHEALAQGVGLVYRELLATLESEGVSSFDPVGERFDPNVHEAIGTRPDGGEPGLVVETLHKGYRLDGQVLRAAAVLVSE